MTDEKYAYTQDVRDKAITARSARNKRTHNGKGGAVRLPSDNLSRKELKAMNGEVKSYRLNAPMKWDEFKALPDDLKVTYIKLIREKFNAPDCEIATMMGVHKVTASQYFRCMGIPSNHGRNRNEGWDKEGFLAWCNGAPLPTSPEEPAEQPEANKDDVVPVPEEKPVCQAVTAPKQAVPNIGSLSFSGNAEAALNTVSALLGGANVHLNITWKIIPEKGACEA